VIPQKASSSKPQQLQTIVALTSLKKNNSSKEDLDYIILSSEKEVFNFIY
jgi:hypothetical protein